MHSANKKGKHMKRNAGGGLASTTKHVSTRKKKKREKWIQVTRRVLHTIGFVHTLKSNLKLSLATRFCSSGVIKNKEGKVTSFNAFWFVHEVLLHEQHWFFDVNAQFMASFPSCRGRGGQPQGGWLLAFLRNMVSWVGKRGSLWNENC